MRRDNEKEEGDGWGFVLWEEKQHCMLPLPCAYFILTCKRKLKKMVGYPLSDFLCFPYLSPSPLSTFACSPPLFL